MEGDAKWSSRKLSKLSATGEVPPYAADSVSPYAADSVSSYATDSVCRRLPMVLGPT